MLKRLRAPTIINDRFLRHKQIREDITYFSINIYMLLFHCCKHIFCETFDMQMKYAAEASLVIVRPRTVSIQCSRATAKAAEIICYINYIRRI